jgi:CheY-like chemotaxis protein/CRP-like cAMP-binding protein
MGKKIVVIEDNKDVRENIGEILELSGYEVKTAPDGIKGMKIIKKDSPDLIICDIMMPELDGYGVLHILQRNPETASIPFIFLTAKSEKEDFRKGMNLGADDYITKPFEEVQLLEAIEVRLQKHSETVPKMHKSGLTVTDEEIFKCLNPLTEESEIRTYPKKAPVFLEGSYPRHLFKVVSGAVKESRWTEFGKELIVNIYTEGDYFGWDEIITDETYQSIASALEDSQLQLIAKEEVASLLMKEQDLYPALLRKSINDNLLLRDKLVKTAYESVRKRMAYILELLHEKYQKDHKIHLLREDIAALAGISKETAIRVLSSFKDEDLISINNNEITINDVDDLANVVG